MNKEKKEFLIGVIRDNYGAKIEKILNEVLLLSEDEEFVFTESNEEILKQIEEIVKSDSEKMAEMCMAVDKDIAESHKNEILNKCSDIDFEVLDVTEDIIFFKIEGYNFEFIYDMYDKTTALEVYEKSIFDEDSLADKKYFEMIVEALNQAEKITKQLSEKI